MSRTRLDRGVASTSGSGGRSARRAVARWAWRLFRREWRQQALVLVLLTVTVVAAVGFASAAYNTVGVPGDAEFGAVDHAITLRGADSGTRGADIAAAQEWFGVIDVVARRVVPIPGSVETVEFRAQDPEGAYGAPMLALAAGRYPTSSGEVAVTDGVAATFQLTLGHSFGLDGTERTVVGVVEDPSDLHDEFALVAPSTNMAADSVTILVDGGADEIEAFLGAHPSRSPGIEVAERPSNQEALAAAGVLGIATFALVLVSLVAAAGFAVVAQRRLRQLGMLGALGATERHLQLVVVMNGMVIGVVAAVLGASVGMAGWIAAAPLLEGAFGHRIDPFNVPWWLIAAAMTLVIVTASVAAWWPARVVARVPITNALSGRPPKPKAAHRSAALAGIFLVTGLFLLVRGGEAASFVLILGGAIAIVAGVLLLSPLTIGALAKAAGSFPFAMRLALRDLARFRARSAAALAAISLVLGVPVAITITASAATAADRGNLSDRQLVIWTRDPAQPEGVSPYFTEDPNDEGFSPYLPKLTEADLDRMAHQAGRIAAELDAPRVTPLDLAVDPDLEPTPDGRLAITLARPFGDGLLDVALVHVASAELVEQYALDLTALDPATDVFTTEETADLRFVGVKGPRTTSDPDGARNIQRLTPSYSSLPGTFVAPEALLRRGWGSVRVGWLIEVSSPITPEDLTEARSLAADAGLLIESRDHREGLLALRWQATVIGMLLALGVLAMTVGLIRIEGASDLRTLTATGATSGIRRSLTATTAGALAFLGAALGTIGAYVAYAAGSVDDLGELRTVPVVYLLAIIAGVPLVAAATGWLLAGHEPMRLARRPTG